MDSHEFYISEEKTIMKEWEYLSGRMRSHDDQMGNIKNWCIVALAGLVGFILSQSDPRDGILIMPFLVIFFFMINEGIKQIWKWKAIIRLYELEKALRQRHRKKNQYQPSIVSNEVREKLEEQLKTFNINKVQDRRKIAIINTIFAFNFALFYGLLYVICSIFLVAYFLFGERETVLLFLRIHILSLSPVRLQAFVLIFVKQISLVLFVICILFVIVNFVWIISIFHENLKKHINEFLIHVLDQILREKEK
jgi:hypothetical protein